MRRGLHSITQRVGSIRPILGVCDVRGQMRGGDLNSVAAQPVTGGGDWGGSHLAKRLLHAEVNHPPNSADCIPSERNGNFGTQFLYGQHSYGHMW